MGEEDELTPAEVRGGLTGAARALAATAETMDRIADLLAQWDERATWGGPASTDEVYVRAWGKAANELRAAIAPMGGPISAAAREVDGRG